MPFTKSPLDIGWLFVFGLLWFVTGFLPLWWLRPSVVESGDDNRLAQGETRLSDLEKAVRTINARLEASYSVINLNEQLHDLNLELDNLGTTIQDAQSS
jgi:hypothetical protein